MHGSFEEGGKKNYIYNPNSRFEFGSDRLFEAQGHINFLASAQHAWREAAGEGHMRGEDPGNTFIVNRCLFEYCDFVH